MFGACQVRTNANRPLTSAASRTFDEWDFLRNLEPFATELTELQLDELDELDAVVVVRGSGARGCSAPAF